MITPAVFAEAFNLIPPAACWSNRPTVRFRIKAIIISILLRLNAKTDRGTVRGARAFGGWGARSSTMIIGVMAPAFPGVRWGHERFSEWQAKERPSHPMN